MVKSTAMLVPSAAPTFGLARATEGAPVVGYAEGALPMMVHAADATAALRFGADRYAG
jgi:hypothetical protein